MDTHSDLVTIRSFYGRPEAMVAKGALEAFGIECVISADDCGGFRPHLTMATGIRLATRAEDAPQALEVLANITEEPN